MVMCEDKCMHENQLTITHKLSHISMYTPYTHQHKHTLNVTLLSIHVTKTSIQQDVSTLRVIVSHNFMISHCILHCTNSYCTYTFVHECSVMSTFSLTPQHEPLPYHNTHTCTRCTDMNTLYKGAPQCTYTQTLY